MWRSKWVWKIAVVRPILIRCVKSIILRLSLNPTFCAAVVIVGHFANPNKFAIGLQSLSQPDARRNPTRQRRSRNGLPLGKLADDQDHPNARALCPLVQIARAFGGLGHRMGRHGEARFCIATFAPSLAWRRVGYENWDRIRSLPSLKRDQRNQRSPKGSGSILIENGRMPSMSTSWNMVVLND